MIIYSADPCLQSLFFISSDNPEVQVAWDTVQLNSCTQMCKVSHCVKHRPQPMQMQISFVLTNDMPPFCLLMQWKVFFNAGKLLLHSFINMRSRLHLLTNLEEIIGKFQRKKKPQLINTHCWPMNTSGITGPRMCVNDVLA